MTVSTGVWPRVIELWFIASLMHAKLWFVITGAARWQGTCLRICEALDLTTTVKQTTIIQTNKNTKKEREKTKQQPP